MPGNRKRPRSLRQVRSAYKRPRQEEIATVRPETEPHAEQPALQQQEPPSQPVMQQPASRDDVSDFPTVQIPTVCSVPTSGTITCNMLAVSTPCGPGSYTLNALPSVHDDLTLNVSPAIRQKIVAGEYIELGNLLGSYAAAPKQTVSIVNGELVVKDKVQDKKLLDIRMWTDAFLIFISVYVSVHPLAIQGLLMHMRNVRLAASRSQGYGWRDYDEQYRLKRARYPSLPWGPVDLDFWALCVQQPQPQVQAINQASRICFDYNYKGVCYRFPCPYLHQCGKCAAGHPSKSCPNQSRMQAQIRPNLLSNVTRPRYIFSPRVQDQRPARLPPARFPAVIGKALGPRSFTS